MTRTASDLRSLFPRGFGVRGISDLIAGEYTDAANRAGLEGEDRARFLELAAERHLAMIRRSEADSLRHYGTPAPHGRLRVMVATMRRRNAETAAELTDAARQVRRELGAQADADADQEREAEVGASGVLVAVDEAAGAGDSEWAEAFRLHSGRPSRLAELADRVHGMAPAELEVE